VQAKQVGLKSHVAGGNGLNSPKLITLAGDAADDVVIGAAYYSGNNYIGNKAFVARYTKKFGSAPDQFAAQAYAAAQITAAAVKAGADTPAGFCSTFARLREIETVLGPVSFEPTRDVRGASAIVKVSKGSFAFF
jgi:branched-chain amino acid transport system substrate-binding protein